MITDLNGRRDKLLFLGSGAICPRSYLYCAFLIIRRPWGRAPMVETPRSFASRRTKAGMGRGQWAPIYQVPVPPFFFPVRLDRTPFCEKGLCLLLCLAESCLESLTISSHLQTRAPFPGHCHTEARVSPSYLFYSRLGDTVMAFPAWMPTYPSRFAGEPGHSG